MIVRAMGIRLSACTAAEAAAAEHRDPLAAADPVGGLDGPTQLLLASDLDECPASGLLVAVVCVPCVERLRLTTMTDITLPPNTATTAL